MKILSFHQLSPLFFSFLYFLHVQAIMMFSVSGSRTEMLGDKENAYNMYIQTLHLIKYVMKLTGSKHNKKDVDIR